MKNSLLRSLSVITAFVIVFCSLSFAASADNSGKSVVVCGQTFDESGYWRINRDKEFVEGSEKYYNIAYDAETNTLTLKDAELYTVYNLIDGYLPIASAVYSSSSLNVNFIGDNTVVMRDTFSEGTHAIYTYKLDSDITVSGDGNLTIKDNGRAGFSAFYARFGKINIKDAKLDVIFNGTESEYTSSIICGKTAEIKNSDLGISFAGAYISYGMSINPDSGIVDIIDSDVEIKGTACAAMCGIFAYNTNVKSSTINININDWVDDEDYYWDGTNYGISTMHLNVENSNVTSEVINRWSVEKNGACNLGMLTVNGKSVGMPYGFMAARSFYINGDDVSYSSIYLNSGLNIYNPILPDSSEYFTAVDGVVNVCTAEENWNIHYDKYTNTLTLRNAKLKYSLRNMGYANIVLEGENSIVVDYGYAMEGDCPHNFTGNGTLTLVSPDACYKFLNGNFKFGDNADVTASTSADGADATAFNAESSEGYKWMKITVTSEEEEKELNFFEKIIQFFKNLFNSFLSLFS